MNTERLIDLLSINLEPVNQKGLAGSLTLGVVIGAVSALLVMLMTVGPRPHLMSKGHLEWSAIKLLFTLSVTAVAARPLLRSMRPGLERDTRCQPIFYFFAATIVVAVTMLLFGYPQASRQMLLGATTISPLRCLVCITIFSAIPFVALIWAVREGAPTRLRLSGALAGTVAGGLGAAAYAIACVSDTIPFIAIWYSAAIAVYAVLGMLLGARLLRW